MKQRILHTLKIVTGWIFVVLGILGLFLPFLQGILFLLIGFSLLSSEYHWAHSLFVKMRQRYPKLYDDALSLLATAKNKLRR